MNCIMSQRAYKFHVFPPLRLIYGLGLSCCLDPSKSKIIPAQHKSTVSTKVAFDASYTPTVITTHIMC